MGKVDAPPLLKPGRHQMNLGEVKTLAVDSFSPNSNRSNLFHSLENLIKRIDKSGTLCELWVDGSFLTEKENPGDIDFTIFISQENFDSCPEEIQNLLFSITQNNKSLGTNLDGYLAELEDQSSKDYWDKFWGHGRNNLPKGYVVISVGRKK